MEPNKEIYGAELPEPMQGEVAPEQTAAQPEVQTATPVATPQAQPMQQPIPQPAPAAPVQSAVPAPSTNVATAALIADDADLIEKEWVEKAKAIVAQTAHDPNLQTKEVGKIKADYMQKRYSKQLKLDES